MKVKSLLFAVISLLIGNSLAHAAPENEISQDEVEAAASLQNLVEHGFARIDPQTGAVVFKESLLKALQQEGKFSSVQARDGGWTPGL